MSQFSDLFSRFAAGPHLGLHGEDVEYVPLGGAARPIRAIVDRNPPDRYDGRGNLVTPRMTIEVLNDPALGVSMAELNAYGSDKLRVAYRVGGEVQEFGIYLPDPSVGDFQSGGMIVLDLK